MYLENTPGGPGLFFPPRKPAHQSSNIFLAGNQPVYVNPYGNYYPAQELFCFGYWGWSDKVADLLPVEYQPSASDND
jgi:hypothetical protein